MRSDSGESGGPDEPETVVGLTIQHVSQLLMVPAPTIRSWERRYGVPVATRSTGGHRRYTHEELHLLRRMRDDIARGHPAAEAAARLSTSENAAAGPLVEQFLESAHRLDSDGVMDALDSAKRSFGLDVTVDAVLLPAMRELGRWWEVGRCDVAHEHLATELCRTWLAGIGTIESDVKQHGPIVLTCGPRDFHSVGLDAMAAMLRQRGWACLTLGVLTPVDSLRLAVHESEGVAVVLVSHLSMSRRSSIEALRSVQRSRTRLFYAGNAFLTRQARYGVPGTYLGTNLSRAADLISAYVTAEYDGEGLIA